MKRTLIVLLIAATALLAGCGQRPDDFIVVQEDDNPVRTLNVTAMASSDPDTKIIEGTFSSTVTFTIKSSAQVPHIASVLMGFNSSQSNTIQIDLIRNSKTYRLVTHEYAGTTLVWFPGNILGLKESDQIRITNTAAVGAYYAATLQY
jgi:type IV pilus biogenesis protein CpaD/CtpE